MLAGLPHVSLMAMDSGFLFVKAVGSCVAGHLGDKYSPVKIVGYGLLGSSITFALLIMGVSTSVITNPAVSSVYFLVIALSFGAFQAPGTPVNTAIMGNWWPEKENRGLTFGVWTCHQYIGEIAAALASYYILSSGLDYRWCLAAPAVLSGLWAFVNFTKVPGAPEDSVVEIATSQISAERNTLSVISFKEAILLPNVVLCTIALGLFDLVKYGMFFQLPVILSFHYTPAQANFITALYSVSNIPGGIICGW